jgi:ribosomal protein S18 acetylase RimI-like enzyme
VNIRPFEKRDEAAVVSLWERCRLTRPWNDPRKDIARKLEVQPELFLVGEIGGAVVASVMAGYEGHRGWVNYLAVAAEHQGQGFGRILMQKVEALLLARGCPKVNVQVRSANGSAKLFYERIGYAQDEAVSLGKRIIPDA